MINGVYEKNGETVELITNGMQEIVPEERSIQHIAMIARKHVPRRKVDSFSIPNAIIFGIVVGMCGGLMVMELIDSTGLVRIWAATALILGSFWLWANYFRKE